MNKLEKKRILLKWDGYTILYEYGTNLCNNIDKWDDNEIGLTLLGENRKSVEIKWVS